jgi:preprotein translocase subunit SecE
MGASWVKASRLFFEQVRQEARRIIWPTQKDVIFTSIIVFIIAAMFAVFLFFVDQIIIGVLKRIL